MLDFANDDCLPKVWILTATGSLLREVWRGHGKF